MARGDHIYVSRWKGCYTHHGIDLGDGTVVHFSGEPLRVRHACVVRESMEVFCGGDTPKVVQHKRPLNDPDEVAETALKHLGKKGYQLWTNNCEHFASFCKTGKPESHQVKRATKVALATVASASVVAAVALVRHRQNIGRDRI